MIKALFFDIDGTLVSFQDHRIPQSTVDALVAAKARGVKIFIATGRPIAIITNITQIASLVDGFITTNGAYCFVGDTVVHTNAILEADVQTALTDAEQQGYPVLVCTPHHLVVHNSAAIVDEVFHQQLGVDNLDYTLTMADVATEPVLQLTPFVTVEQERQLLPHLSSYTSGRWHPAFTDITAGGTDKGAALHIMARFLGLDIAHCMAFGDGGNDISMIREAGIGVAMGNANDALKAVADYITTPVDEEGVKRALQHFGVIE